MPRFQKNKPKLGYRTPDFFKEQLTVPKSPPRAPKPRPPARQVRYIQHKG